MYLALDTLLFILYTSCGNKNPAGLFKWYMDVQEDGIGTKISATILSSLEIYLSLAPQDVMAPELQEVSLYQFILI